jgi:hypothetical protein
MGERGIGDTAAVITVVLFIVFIIVACATVIPQLYRIASNTQQLKVGGDVVDGLDQLHTDLLVVQSQLNLAAGLLISMNTSISEMNVNIDTLVNG